MTPFLRKLLGLNWLLLIVMLALAIFGVVAIYSATYMRDDPVTAEFWRKQAQWIAVGFFAFMIASLVNYHWIRWGALPMYLAGIVFLVLTKFMGQKVYGARSWLHLGPINFQPAQLAVVAGIMVLALFLSQFKQMHPMLRLLVCGAVAGAACVATEELGPGGAARRAVAELDVGAVGPDRLVEDGDGSVPRSGQRPARP